MTANDDDDALERDDLMRSMRSVWLDMRDGDAEPPARGFSELMAAARVKAELMQPETAEPWWRRGFAMLLRPPMLAAATVVVLVGGAVVLSQRGTEVPRSASTDVTRGDAERSAKPQVIAREAQPGAPAGEAPPSIEVAPADTVAPVRPEHPRRRPPAIVREPIKDLAAPRPDPHVGAKLPADTGGTDLGITDENEERPALKKETKVPDVTGRAPQSDGVLATDTVPAARPPAGPSPTEQLIKQAEAAAKRSDCAAVKVTAERIRKVDGNVYKARVVTQPAIARCLK